MPLQHSGSKQAFDANVKTLMKDIGKSPHVQSRSQALAVAYSVKRRARAEGGPVHVGPISSTVPGRTDKHAIDVPAGAYIIPAECVSNLGQSNTNAGMVKLDEIMNSGPEEIRRFFGAGRTARATGGRTEEHRDPVPIMAAGGEYAIDPGIVSIIGGGDTKQGHKVLDAWVMSRRKNHIKTLKGLAPPADD